MPPQQVLLHDVAWTNGMIEFQPGNVGRPPAYHVEVLAYYEYSRPAQCRVLRHEASPGRGAPPSTHVPANCTVGGRPPDGHRLLVLPSWYVPAYVAGSGSAEYRVLLEYCWSTA